MSRFKILWIDDQKTKCRKDVGSVERIITAFGFEPDIHVEDDISKESLKETGGKLHTAICARDIDLFIVDYNLKNDLFGTDLIEDIRMNNNIFTDIVFYSSDPTSLVGAVKNSFDSASIMNYFDGVYIAPLGEEFSEKIHAIITKIIKSWYNVHSIRGIILSKASKFEQMVSEIIRANYITCLPSIKEGLVTKGGNVCKATTNKWESVKKHNDPIPQILSDPIGFNWTVKKMILKELDTQKVISISTWAEIEKIFGLRNDFAHNPIHLKDGVLVLKTKDNEIIFNEDEIEEVRNELTKIEDELSSVLSQNKNVDTIAAASVVKKDVCLV